MNKISHHRQLGGIETSVLDNGPGNGVRIAWFNTGSGLRYKVVLDRAMDIADAFFNHASLTWLSHQGIKRPDPSSAYGNDWLRTFGGGLMVTCGLAHAGAAETRNGIHRGLHGRVSNLPSEIISIVQPDLSRGIDEMSITGLIKESTALGERLELKRKISSSLGRSVIRIQDQVTNTGNTSARHMILYHCNFGWPLVDEGARLLWDGILTSRGQEQDNAIFLKENYKICPSPISSHNGNGEACAFIDPFPDNSGLCRCGIINTLLGLRLELRFYKHQLPLLTNWQHWAKGEYTTGLEPGSYGAPLVPQNFATTNDLYLLPGEMRSYHLEIEIFHLAS